MTNSDILREIKELCQGLALSEKARALRYDKIVELLKNCPPEYDFSFRIDEATFNDLIDKEFFIGGVKKE